MTVIIWNLWKIRVFLLLFQGGGMKDMGVL